MTKLKVGVLGTGFINEAYHLPAFSAIPDIEVSAVYGRTEEKTVEFVKKWGIPNRYFGPSGLEQICSDPELDIIDVGLPNYLHLDAVRIATDHHKAVICEKPLGRNSCEAKKMLDAAKRAGVIHCYAENQVFMPKAQYVRELIKNGAIGRITSVRSREAHSGPHSTWFKTKELAGGGVLLDMGCHTIELARKLIAKRARDVCAWIATLSHKIDVEDNCLALVRYEGETLGVSEASWSAMGGLDVRFEVFGTEGTIFVDMTRETGLRVFTTGKGTGAVVEKADATSGWLFPSLGEHEGYGFVAELRHFTDCIAKDKLPSETFEDGYVVNCLVDAAYESAAERRWIIPGS
jgi:predicted dehydrogenase